MRRVLILIVEDRAADANEVTWTLSDVGVDEATAKIVHVSTSDEAIAFVSDEHPSTVLMDINLQGSPIDGFELTRQIRALNGFDVVILTTSTSPDDIGRARDCGARAYMEKLEGSEFAKVMSAFKYVFLEGNYCPPQWVDRFVWIDDQYIDPD